MFKKLIKNKKAQNTAEYAILISLVVAGIIAMQTYAQRALQGKVRDATSFLNTQTSSLGQQTKQYEPYYLTTNYLVDRNENQIQILDNRTVGGIQQNVQTNRTRGQGGFQESSYDTSLGLSSGL
jgi:Flp pilus assembly pilin Flp